jgi:uncharacterized protein YggU (UPF0235/DUF167 family)
MTRKLDDFNITDRRSGAAFTLRIVTRAARDEIAGLREDGTLKIRLAAAPTEANAALIAFLAARLGVEARAIEIVSGKDERLKMVMVEGITSTDVEERLKPDADASDDDD